jgi:hypothetical protein
MGKLAHAARKKPGPVAKPRGAAPTAKAGARAKPSLTKASWTFGGFDGGTLAAAGAQAKMEVSKPGDALEHEADRMADRAMHAHAHAGASSGAHHDTEENKHGGHVMRACDSCATDEEKKPHIQRKPQTEEEIERAEKRDIESQSPMTHAQRMAEKHGDDEKKVHRMAMGKEDDKKVHRMAMGKEDDKKVHRLAEGDGEAEGRDEDAETSAWFEERLRGAQLGGGMALPGPLRALMESRFGTSFQRVRVHVGEAGAALARSVRARAFTVGRHIFFAPGRFQPHTEQGQRLVAHELTHVMQQRGGLHSVQREVDAVAPPEPKNRAAAERQAKEDAASPGAISFGRFMRQFELREGVTPPLVLEIIKELVERAQQTRPEAEKLLPLLDPGRAGERTVRRWLRSRSHELRLEASRVPGRRESVTQWELRFLDRTRVPAEGGRAPGGTDEDAIDVGDTGRPTEPADPGADLKAKVANAPSPPPAPAPAEVPLPAGETAAPAAGEGAAAAAATAKAAAGPEPAPAPGEPGAIEAAAATPGAPAAGAVSAAAKGAVAAVEEKIPRTPEEDPSFKKVVAGADRAKKQSATHGKAGAAAVNAEAAAPVDAAEKTQFGQEKQVDKMSVQETDDFGVDALVHQIEKQVADNTPKTLDEAKNFKNDGVVGKLGDQVRGKTGAEADKTGAALEKVTDRAPDASVAPRTAAELATAPIGAKPKDIDAGRAVPPERPRGQVEGAIEANKQAMDAKVAALGLDDADKTFRESNEPKLMSALGTKASFEADATAGPAEFRKGEAGGRADAKKENADAGVEGLGAMFGKRSDLIGKVRKGQTGGKTKSEKQHDKIKLEIDKTYAKTKKSVDDHLATMKKDVFETFDSESKAALSAFENGVVAAEKRWNDKSFFDRLGQRIDKVFNKIPTELDMELGAIRNRFIAEMSRIVRKVAEIAARELKAAKQAVKDGRAEKDKAIASLGKNQGDLKAQLEAEFGGKFDELEGSIKTARDEMVEGVAKRYTDNVAATDKQLQEVKDRNKGWVEKAGEKYDEAKKLFGELKDKLMSVFKKAGAVVLQIINDPKRFMKNLFAGISEGFQRFRDHIGQHLVKGAIEWLTGAVGSTIVLPEHFDPAGILSIFLQLVGLTIDNVKARARVIWGDKVVDAIEMGIAGAEAAFDLFQTFKKEGVMGLVRRLKDQLVSLKDQAIEKIKGILEVEIVKAAVKALLKLLTPVGALVQAVITIVNTVMFFIRNASRLAALIDTIVEGASDVMSGNVSGLAIKVEGALAAAVPIVLDFLAALLDLGTSVVDKIRAMLAFIRKPVDDAIDFVLKGIKNLIGPFIAKVAGGLGFKPAQPAGAPAKPAAAAATVPTAAGATAPGARPKPGAPVTVPAQPAAPGSPEAVRDFAFDRMHEPDPEEMPQKAIDFKKRQAAKLVEDSRKALPPTKKLKIDVDSSVNEAEADAAVHFDVGLSPGKKGTSKIPKVIDTRLRAAVNSVGILKFLRSMANGDPVGDIDRNEFARLWNTPSSTGKLDDREFVKGKFRAVGKKEAKTGVHEWIPSALILEVVDRAGKKIDGPTPDGVENAADWLSVQNKWRSPTELILMAPRKYFVTFSDTAGSSRRIVQGHPGAVFHPEVNKDGTLNQNELKGRTVGADDMHKALEAAFRNNNTIAGVRAGVADAVEKFLWQPTESAPSDTSEHHRVGKERKPVDGKGLQGIAQAGSDDFIKKVMVQDLATGQKSSE